jgi:hypothetical protein
VAISERFASLRSESVLFEDRGCPAMISPKISSVGRTAVLHLVVSRVPRCGSRTGSPLPFRRLSPRGWPGTILPPSAGGVGINPDRCSTIELRVRRSARRSRAVCQSEDLSPGRCRVRSWLRSTPPRGKTVAHFENRLCLRTSRSKLGGPYEQVASRAW